jgi:geranylgeranyl diphosphate synthase type I
MERKATSVVVAAYLLADPSLRRQLRELMGADHLDAADIDRWRDLIVESGAVDWIEQLIDVRLAKALALVDDTRVRSSARTALSEMALACTERVA